MYKTILTPYIGEELVLAARTPLSYLLCVYVELASRGLHASSLHSSGSLQLERHIATPACHCKLVDTHKRVSYMCKATPGLQFKTGVYYINFCNTPGVNLGQAFIWERLLCKDLRYMQESRGRNIAPVIKVGRPEQTLHNQNGTAWNWDGSASPHNSTEGTHILAQNISDRCQEDSDPQLLFDFGLHDTGGTEH